MDLTASSCEKIERIKHQVVELETEILNTTNPEKIASIQKQIAVLNHDKALLEKGVVKVTLPPPPKAASPTKIL